MKKILLTTTLLILLGLLPASRVYAQAGLLALIKGVTTRVVKAIDLKVQRMQTKVVGLQSAQKAVENALSKLKLKQIAGWLNKSKNLYQQYYEGLWQVKKIWDTYRQVRRITEDGRQLVREYEQAWSRIRGDPHFRPEEVAAMHQAYSALLEESLQQLDKLTLAVRAYALQMNDGDRLQLIQSAAKGIAHNLADLRAFNRHTLSLSRARGDQQAAIRDIGSLYGRPQP